MHVQTFMYMYMWALAHLLTHPHMNAIVDMHINTKIITHMHNYAYMSHVPHATA